MKYTVTRCFLSFGEDIERKEFDRKADAIKWGRRANHCRVRLNGVLNHVERPIVFSKGY